MLNIAISLMCLALGLVPLRLMYRWEQKRGAPLTRFTFIYFALQYGVFTCGGTLLALFHEGRTYLTLFGYFPVADGIARLQLINVVSLYAALAGTALIMFRPAPAAKRHTNRDDVAETKALFPESRSSELTLRAICYVSLAVHCITIGVQWYGVFGTMPPVLRYLVQIAAKTAPATFFFQGLWWLNAGKGRSLIALYGCTYGILQLAAGGRAPILYAAIMFIVGLFSRAPRWIVRPRRILLFAGLASIVPYLSVRSEDIRLLYSSREPVGLADWSRRIINLLGPRQVIQDSSGVSVAESDGGTIFRFASRVTELSALDVVARTPEQLPFWGWTEIDWENLRIGWLPSFIFPDRPDDENAGVLYLRAYGWAVDPEGGHAMPATILGDSWRRFGWTGVIIANFVWGAFLAIVSTLLRRRMSISVIAFSGAVFYIFTFAYTDDITTLITAMPRRILSALLYAVVITVGCRLIGEIRTKEATAKR